MKIYITILLILVFSLCAFGQTKKPLPIVNEPAKAVNTIINIEAAIVYRNGDVKPVARVEFFLLDSDLDTILRTETLYNLYKSDVEAVNAKFHFGLTIKPLSEMTGIEFYKNFHDGETVTPNYFAEAAKQIQSHIKFRTQTDFTGKAKFENIPTGKYFLYGDAGTQKGFSLWLMPVEAKGEAQSFILDSNNAIYAH